MGSRSRHPPVDPDSEPVPPVVTVDYDEDMVVLGEADTPDDAPEIGDPLIQLGVHIANITRIVQEQHREMRILVAARSEAFKAQAVAEARRADFWAGMRTLIGAKHFSITVLIVATILAATFAARVGGIDVNQVVTAGAIAWRGCPTTPGAPVPQPAPSPKP